MPMHMRAAAGLLVRQAGPLWVPSLVLAAALAGTTTAAGGVSNPPTAIAAGAGPSFAHSAALLDGDDDDVVDAPWVAAAAGRPYAALLTQVHAHGLVGVWDLRPLLDVRRHPRAQREREKEREMQHWARRTQRGLYYC
jgi:hypothetical protein